jgi:hypothetical protein
MCIQIAISPLDKRTKSLDLGEVTSVSSLLAESNGHGVVVLCPRGECPCGFAAGNPTGNDWRVRDDLRPALIRAVQFAAKQMKRFRLTATWLGDPPATERNVSLKELTQLINGGVIANSAFIVRTA